MACSDENVFFFLLFCSFSIHLSEVSHALQTSKTVKVTFLFCFFELRTSRDGVQLSKEPKTTCGHETESSSDRTVSGRWTQCRSSTQGWGSCPGLYSLQCQKARQTKLRGTQAEVQNRQAKSQNPENKKQSSKREELLRQETLEHCSLQKNPRQTGNKGNEGVAYMHKWAGKQQETGETCKGNCRRWEKEQLEEVNILSN